MHIKLLTESAHSKLSGCGSVMGVFLPSPPAKSACPFIPTLMFSIAVVWALQGSQRHLDREALSSPSPTSEYCQDPRAKGHSFSSGTARGRDRTALRVGFNERPCSTAQKVESGFGRMEADPGEMCVHVSERWWWWW